MASTLTPKMRECVMTDPFFERSCLSGRSGSYGDPIRIHHVFKWAGKQIQETFNIVPLLDSEHDNHPKSAHRCQDTREKVELICLQRASDEKIKKFGLEQKKKYLLKKYEGEQCADPIQ